MPRHDRKTVPFEIDNCCCAACNEAAAIPAAASASADSELLLLAAARHLVVQFRYGVKVDGDKNTSIDGSSCPRSVSSELYIYSSNIGNQSVSSVAAYLPGV